MAFFLSAGGIPSGINRGMTVSGNKACRREAQRCFLFLYLILYVLDRCH